MHQREQTLLLFWIYLPSTAEGKLYETLECLILDHDVRRVSQSSV